MHQNVIVIGLFCVAKQTARMTYLALHVIVHAVTSPQAVYNQHHFWFKSCGYHSRLNLLPILLAVTTTCFAAENYQNRFQHIPT